MERAFRRNMRLAPALAVIAFVLASCAGRGVRFEGISLSASTWDVGTIKGEERQTLVMRVANEGSEPRTLSVLATCPCVAISKTPVALAPGARDKLTFTFDPGGIPGPVNVMLVFLTDLPESKGYLLRMRGTVAEATARR